MVERHVLWLATAIVHYANKVRPSSSGVKVGGHQTSSASMVSIVTALWFGRLRAPDRVSVKPHASPILHAINPEVPGVLHLVEHAIQLVVRVRADPRRGRLGGERLEREPDLIVLDDVLHGTRKTSTPRWASWRTKPSRASEVKASRTGVALTEKRSAISAWRRRAPAPAHR